ncbi:hypothetical protein D3C86_1985940 [compost metagenome]
MLLPGMDHEDADHLAEQLADFRRGDEIAVTAEGFARAVITVFRIGEAKREIIRNGDGTVCPDQILDLFGQGSGVGSAHGRLDPS